MHELGHNLGLRHGGGNGIDLAADGVTTLSANCKPNYLSVMNYNFQMPDRPVPLTSWKLDYSGIQLPTLNEGTSTAPALNEATGVFGIAANQALLTGRVTAFTAPTSRGGRQVLMPSATTAINWDGDRLASPGPPQFVFDDVNNFGTGSGCDGTGASLAGFNDWTNLVYAFQNTVDFDDGIRTVETTTDAATGQAEITREESDAIVANTAPLLSLTKTASQAPNGSFGSDVTYTLQATNQGPKTATNVTISDVLADGVTFDSARAPGGCSRSTVAFPDASRAVVTCNAGTLNVGSTATATITVTLTKVGTFTDQGAVSSDPDKTLFQSNATKTTIVDLTSGFNPPISNPPAINQVQAGSNIPVKFSIGGNFGTNILASGSPQSQQVACSSLPGPNVTTIGNPSPISSVGMGFNLVPAPNQYMFSWQTSPSFAGTCRELSVQLNGGTPPHVAFFQFF